MITITIRQRLRRQLLTFAAHDNLQQRRPQQQKQLLQRCGIYSDSKCFVDKSPACLHRKKIPFPMLYIPSTRIFFSTHNVPRSEERHDGTHTSGSATTKMTDNYSPRVSFQDLGLHPKILEALRKQGIHQPTEIQEKTHELIVNGHNVLGRARTGTGKTLAFLVPTIERFLKTTRQENEDQRKKAENDESWSTSSLSESTENLRGIPILVLSPTRELAAQIGKEAEKLISVHNSTTNDKHQKLTSQVVYGGSSKKEDVQHFQHGLPTILVATPGRLKDHLASTTLKVTGSRKRLPFRSVLQNGNLQTLVLDETDRLLELGFRRDVQDILSCLNNFADPTTSAPSSTTASSSLDSSSYRSKHRSPRPSAPQHSRQTLLFSATLTTSIMDVVDLAITEPPSSSLLKNERTAIKLQPETIGDQPQKNYHLVDCVQNDDPTTHTNTNTKQSYIMLPPERFWTRSMELILRLMTTRTNASKNNAKKNRQKHKIIVFFELTSLARLYSRFLSLRLGHTVGVWELHGKMHQRERSVASRRFRDASNGVLLTSDVSARGVDYPGVTHVVQIGSPRNRETYIHRVGRTGRAGNSGEGLLILPQLLDDDHDKPQQLQQLGNDLEDLELVHDESLERAMCSRKRNPQRILLENELEMLRHDLKTETDTTGMAEAVILAYQSLISYYFQTSRRQRIRDDESSSGSQQLQPEASVVANFLNQLVADFGLPELPAIGFQRAKSMGISHLGGQLNIRKNWQDHYQYNHGLDDDGTNFRRPRGGTDDWFGLS